MRQRLIAVLILLIMLGIPGILYWIFFVKNISSVTISLENNISADVRLSGTFSYSWLPLADTILNFSKKCDTECRFENIPAANYTLTIESENYLPINDNFSLQNGENLQKMYRLTRTTDLEKTEVPTPLTRDEKILRNADFSQLLWENFRVIDRDMEGKIWLAKTENSETTIGFLRDEKFVSVATLPYIFEEILLDFYENAFIFRSNHGEILMTIDGENIFETKLPEGTFSVFFQEKMWHATTREKTFLWKNNEWRENVRFSHWRDLDDIWRAGFIRADAENLLKLSNYSLEEGSVLLLLNRKTGEIFQVARNLDISRFSVIDGRIYAVQNNDFYLLKIPK